MQNETDYLIKKVSNVLEKADYENERNQYRVFLSDLESLIDAGGEIVILNKLVGSCYYHVVKYGKKEFFDVTGTPRYLVKDDHSKLVRKVD